MNKACTIYFHPDSAPAVADLPQRYQDNVSRTSPFTGNGDMPLALGIDVGHAFYIDFDTKIIRTRIGGKEANPVDFYRDNILFIEWYEEGSR